MTLPAARPLLSAVILAVLVFLPLSASGGESERVEIIKARAEKGDPGAQWVLGSHYLFGSEVDRVAKDEVEGVKWLRKAADQGYAFAQYDLGNCYTNGQGVAKDAVEAVKWYRKAAEQGYSVAQYRLGRSYTEGIGVAKDAVEAVKWYRKAAEQGYSSGLGAMGICYKNGHGVAKDAVEAYAYASLDTPFGFYDKRLEEGMSPDFLIRAQQRAKELRKEIDAKIAAKQAEDVKKAGK